MIGSQTVHFQVTVRVGHVRKVEISSNPIEREAKNEVLLRRKADGQVAADIPRTIVGPNCSAYETIGLDPIDFPRCVSHHGHFDIITCDRETNATRTSMEPEFVPGMIGITSSLADSFER